VAELELTLEHLARIKAQSDKVITAGLLMSYRLLLLQMLRAAAVELERSDLMVQVIRAELAERVRLLL